EALPGAVFACCALAGELHPAATRDELHLLRRSRVEGELRREDHADALARAVGEPDRVADAAAVEVDVGLRVDGDAVEALADGHGILLLWRVGPGILTPEVVHGDPGDLSRSGRGARHGPRAALLPRRARPAREARHDGGDPGLPGVGAAQAPRR